MITKWSRNSSVFREFDANFQNKWFDFRGNLTCHHVDSLYYTVYLDEPEYDEYSEDDSGDLLGVKAFVSDLREAKQRKLDNPSEELLFFGDLSVALGAFSIYSFHLQLPECFDVFVSSGLPNPKTPRIVVQLRTNYLVNEMLCLPEDAVEDSLASIRAMMASYGVQIDHVDMNRIDYAFHTNNIQNMHSFFSDNLLTNKLCTTLRRYDMSGKIEGRFRPLGLDYLSFGRRTSNDIFVRIYNKIQEVIEMNYKSFFFRHWLDLGLISEYDAYCLEVAYKYASYRSGLLIGRIKWYLEYGHNDGLKAELQQILESDFVKSDNCQDMEKRIAGVLPPVTLIVNIEFQTKKHFFDTLKLDLKQYLDRGDCKHVACVLGSSARILDYLTSKTLCFKNFDDSYCYFWTCLRRSALTRPDKLNPIRRQYSRTVDGSRSRRRCLGAMATQAVINRGFEYNGIEEDIAAALCGLNDNDVKKWHYSDELADGWTVDALFNSNLKLVDMNTGEALTVDDVGYQEIRDRRARQYRRYLRERGKQDAIS